MSKTSLDLSALDTIAASDKGARVELRHPATNAPLGVFISVYGKDSTIFRSHVRDAQNARIRATQAAQRRGKAPDAVSVEEREAEALDLIVALTFEFENIELDGEKLSFTPANARKLYTRLPWVMNQVDIAIGDLENFMKP